MFEPALTTLSPDAALILLKNVTLYQITDHWWLEQTVKKLIAFRSRKFVACHSNPNVPEGTVTRFCACAATWFLFWRTVFQDWRLVKKSSSIDPETPEKAIISVFKSYLVHLGSFKRHILYFCASIVEKIRSHWGELHEAMCVVVSFPTNGSNVAFNVVIWLSLLSIKVLQSTIYLWRIFFKR